MMTRPLRLRHWIGAWILLMPALVSAHGGVSMEDDSCILRIGKYRAHFTGYQPEQRATQEFCEDIPEQGRAIIVVDFIDEELRSMTVEFRILRDVQLLGNNARYEQLGSEKDIQQATLLERDARAYPRGTVHVEQAFPEGGRFIGLVRATNPQTGEQLVSVFPFSVGVTSYWKYLPWFLLVLGVSGGLVLLTGGRPPESTAQQQE